MISSIEINPQTPVNSTIKPPLNLNARVGERIGRRVMILVNRRLIKHLTAMSLELEKKRKKKNVQNLCKI